MIIGDVTRRLGCPLPTSLTIGIVAAAAAVGGFLVWLSIVHVRGKSLTHIRFAAAVGIAVVLAAWSAHLAASEPVLVSGMLNRGAALALVVLSLCLALLGTWVRKRESTLAALLFTGGAALIIGAALGWTWRSQQPCKHGTRSADLIQTREPWLDPGGYDRTVDAARRGWRSTHHFRQSIFGPL